MIPSKRVLLVGWDAADWKVIDGLIARGWMPNVQRLFSTGVRADLATLNPPLSPMMWTSIATGKRPFKHGILGFIEPMANGKGSQPITNLGRTTKAIWNILNQNGKRSNVVGWWPSHPVEPINGVMVSNHFQMIKGPLEQGWPLMPQTVHPPELAEALAELRVHPEDLEADHIRPFLPHGDEIDQQKDGRFLSLAKMICECSSIQAAAVELIETQPWDFMAVYFDSIDHFSHGFMRYHPPRRDWVSEKDFHLYQNVVSAAYVYHDMMLGRLMELAGDDTVVMLCSDHGFHSDDLRPAEIPADHAGPSAEHRDFGVFAMAGPGIRQGVTLHGATLLDVTPTILRLYGLPTGADMDGRPLLEGFEETLEPATIPSWDAVEGSDGQHPPEQRLAASNSSELMDQMVALGYIEPPDENAEKAAAMAQREMDYNLAISYMDANRHGDAAPILARLLNDNPLDFRCGVQLAHCCRALGAIDDLATLVDYIHSSWQQAAPAAAQRLKDFQAELKSRPSPPGTAEPTDPTEPAGEAKDTDLSQRMSEAESRVVRSLRSIARINPRTLTFLGSCVAQAKGDMAAAIARLERASDANKALPAHHMQLADTYLKHKRFEEAAAAYHRALELDPDRAHAHLGLGRVALHQKRPQEALGQFEAAVARKHHFPVAHFYLAVAQLRLDDTDAAKAELLWPWSQNPNFAEAHQLLARIHRQMEHHRNAPCAIARPPHGCGISPCRQKQIILPPLPRMDAERLAAELPASPSPIARRAPLPGWVSRRAPSRAPRRRQGPAETACPRRSPSW